MPRANPEKIAYASAGPGSTNHLCAALFENMTGIRMVHVPYRGGQPAVTDTVAGQTQLFFSAATQTMPHVEGRPAAAACGDRGDALEPPADIPTVGEAVPGYEMAVWYGAFGPKGMDARAAAAPERRTEPRHGAARGQGPAGRHGRGGRARDHARPSLSGCARMRRSGAR